MCVLATSNAEIIIYTRKTQSNHKKGIKSYVLLSQLFCPSDHIEIISNRQRIYWLIRGFLDCWFLRSGEDEGNIGRGSQQ